MTKQEAEAFVARLKRIWGCDENEEADWHIGEDGFSADLPIQEGISLLIYPAFWTLKSRNDAGALIGSLIFSFETARVHWPKRNDSQTLFATQWLPFFRRGCWLSGCPLEASAHEKVEWIQGFTPQEIEAWNLNL